MSWKKIVLLVTVGVAGLALATYRYMDPPVPDGYSPSSTRVLKAVLMPISVMDFVATAAYSMGFGVSPKDNWRRLTKFFLNQFPVKSADYDDVQAVDQVFNGVPVRVYRPPRQEGVLRGFVWYHGGGWTFGSLESTDVTARSLCKQMNAVVVSVDYRLAPEHVFPAAFEDCVTATKFFMSNANQFNVDPERIAIGGDSAGGNLAATVSIKLRDDDFRPTVKLQVLVYPVIQGLDFRLPSYLKNANGPVLTNRAMSYFTLAYLEGNDDKIDILLDNGHVSPAVKKQGLPHIDVSKLPKKYLVGYEKPSVDTGNETIWNEMKDKLLNPYFSPIVAKSLENLPPAYVFTAEHDPLRDEGILYARRLEEFGVKVAHRHSDFAIHSLVTMSTLLPEADKLFREMTSFINDNL